VPFLLRLIVFPFGREFRGPTDVLSHEVCGLVLRPGPARERLTAGMFIPTSESDAIATLEAALAAVIEAEPLEAQMRAARHDRPRPGGGGDLAAALASGTITRQEMDCVQRARTLRRKVIMVDDFPKDLGRTEVYQTTEAVSFGVA
jgi:acyl-CoA dehydrogenase